MLTTIIGSWRNWQTRHVQTVQIGVRIPASRPFPAWRNWLTRSAQTRLNASASRAEHMWVRIPPLGPSRGVGSIPASATNCRFVQWKDGGPTNRSRGFDSLTGEQLDGGRRQTARRGSVKPALAGSTPAAHPSLNVAGRRVIGSPPASGAGAWRFESSRPDHCQPERSGFESRPHSQASSVVARRGRSAMPPPFKRNHAGSTPADGTTPGFVQRQDVRPITGESGFESSSLDHVDEVLPEAPFRPASWCGHSARPKPERTWFDPTAGHHEYPTTPRATTSPS